MASCTRRLQQQIKHDFLIIYEIAFGAILIMSSDLCQHTRPAGKCTWKLDEKLTLGEFLKI